MTSAGRPRSARSGIVAFESLLERETGAASHPADVPPHLGDVPVLVCLGALPLTDDFQSLKAPGGNLDRLDAHDAEGVEIDNPSALVLEARPVLPAPTDFEWPREPGLGGTVRASTLESRTATAQWISAV